MKRLVEASTLLAAAALAVLALATGSAQAALSPVPQSPVGGPGSAESQFSEPAGVDVNPTSGDVYVTDTGNNRVQRFSADGTFISTFGWGVDDGSAEAQVCTSGCEAGIAGSGEGQLSSPAGIAVDPSSGDVYVGNGGDGRIERFTADGAFVEAFEGEPLSGLGPYDTMAFAPNGLLYAAVPGQILGFDPSGVPQANFPGFAAVPIAADFDSSGRLFVADTNGSSSGVHVFTLGGELPQILPQAPPSALAVDRGSDRLLVGQAENRFAPGLTLSEVEADGDVLVHSFAPGTVAEATGSAFDPAASLPGTEGGAYYLADTSADRLVILSSVPRAPHVQRTLVSEVSAQGAVLKAAIDPNYRDTTFSFEYGPTTTYGATAPATAGDVGGDGIEHLVGTRLSGLQPATTYHYRVLATNSLGAVQSGDRTFTTNALGGAFALPDDRVWEQVSPLAKNDNEPQTPDSGGGAPASSMASADGNAIAYSTSGAFPGGEASTRSNVALSARSALDWSTKVLDPEIDPPPFLGTNNVVAVSPDLSHAVVCSGRALAADAVADKDHLHLYLRDNRSGAYRLLATFAASDCADHPRVVGGSNDFSHLVLISNVPLTGDGTEGASEVYDWTAASGLSLVPGSDGVGYGNDYGGPVARVGDRFVYFGSDHALYLREGGTSVQVVAGFPRTHFWGMSEDGTKIVFTTDQKLTPEAQANHLELYRYDADSGELETITAGLNVGAPGEAQQVFAVQGVSADGETVVFSGVENEGFVGGPETSPSKLYVSRGGRIGFVTTVSPEFRAGAVSLSPNGRFLALPSSTPLTDQETGGFEQIYRYDTDTAQLSCVSCPPSGVAPSAAASLRTDSGAFATGVHLRNALDDGRVFFQTQTPLVREDVNARMDVYEWEDGRPWLISDGRSETGSYFADASASGNDVFFTTRAKLVGQDRDNYVDVYDARVNGGLASQQGAPAASACAGEACQGTPGGSPAGAAIASSQISGPGAPGRKAKKKGRTSGARVAGAKVIAGTSAKVRVTVTAPGTIRATGPSVVSQRKSVKKAGTYPLSLPLKPSARRQLLRKGQIEVSVRVRFTLPGGSASTTTVHQTLRKAGSR